MSERRRPTKSSSAASSAKAFARARWISSSSGFRYVGIAGFAWTALAAFVTAALLAYRSKV